MRGRRTPPRVPEARALYARGASMSAVARALGVSLATVYRWRRADALDWDELRAKTGAVSPGALLLGLEQLLGLIVIDTDLGPAAKARAVGEVYAALKGERAFQAEAAGLGRFAQWAAAALPEQAGRAVLDAVAAYAQALRNGDAPPLKGACNG